jgi:hypothetical protein
MDGVVDVCVRLAWGGEANRLHVMVCLVAVLRRWCKME